MLILILILILTLYVVDVAMTASVYQHARDTAISGNTRIVLVRAKPNEILFSSHHLTSPLTYYAKYRTIQSLLSNTSTLPPPSVDAPRSNIYISLPSAVVTIIIIIITRIPVIPPPRQQPAQDAAVTVRLLLLPQALGTRLQA